MKQLLMSTAFCLLAWSAPAAVPPAIDLTVRVNRTALYPGDRLEYTVRAEHDSSIEFVQDHVRKDQLALDPFEILDLSTAAGDLPGDRKFFELRLLLTTYDTGKSTADVPGFNLFYFGKGKRQSDDNAPAETLAVPPMKIGLSSTLTGDDAAIRVSKPPLRGPAAAWIVPGALGLCCLLAAAAYLIFHLVAWVRTGFPGRVKAERKIRRSVRESLDEIRQAPVDSPESALWFYDEASRILRGLADERLGDCAGLTPREMEAALRQAGDGEFHAAALAWLMEQCDLVRYSPQGAENGMSRRTEFLRKFEELAEQR